MSCNNTIEVADVAEVKIACMNRVNFDFMLQFFLDEEYTVEDTLAGSRFDMVVRDKDNAILLAFSTETDPGGLTIDGYNDLTFNKTAEQMDLTAGMYKYVLQRTVNNEVIPVMKGDFIISENTNDIDIS